MACLQIQRQPRQRCSCPIPMQLRDVHASSSTAFRNRGRILIDKDANGFRAMATSGRCYCHRCRITHCTTPL